MIEIRPATPADVALVVPLFEAYRVFYEKKPDYATAAQFVQARLERSESVIFVALDGAEAVGFTQLYPLFSSTRMQRLWLLNDLYVAESHRGQGISKLLLERAQTWAQETEAAGLLLETAKTNHVGNQLYPATGFELVDSVNWYFWAQKGAP
jgi:GNAT superfamily N-acetyltransferase